MNCLFYFMFAVIGLLLSLMMYYSILWIAIYILMCFAVIILGALLGMAWTFVKSRPYNTPKTLNKTSPVSELIDNLIKSQDMTKNGERSIVISQVADAAIQEILDLIFRDYILSWYKEVGKQPEKFICQVNKDVWLVIGEVSERLSNVDWLGFCTQEVVNACHDHFRDVKLAAQKRKEGDVRPKFFLHSWLANEESEIMFLRNLSEVLLLILLPDYLAECKVVRHLLREILSLSVLKPTIDGITDPDYINLKIIEYVDYRDQLSEGARKTYTYAETYEDFVKMIDNLDIEQLKQIRYTIITEIMQATTISNLKRERGIDTDRETAPRHNVKGDLLKSRNLKRYINQLTLTKSRCEKRIHSLGGPNYKTYVTESSLHLSPDTLAPQKILSFSEVMNIGVYREQFLQYLKRDGFDSLLRFWIAVEKFRDAPRNVRHQIASDIYQRYVASPTTVVRLEKSLLKRMESFLLGNDGPSSFYEAQKIVLHELEEECYPSFIVSDVYHRVAQDSDVLEGPMSDEPDSSSTYSEVHISEIDADEDSGSVSSQSAHAQQILEHLLERISNKTHAIHALKLQKSDEKIQKVIEDMNKELASKKEEKRELESHIERTNVWCENIGMWRATIYDSAKDGDEENTSDFIILVHLYSGSANSAGMSNSSQGWVVSRSLDDFNALHTKLSQIGPWLKKTPLPTITWFRSVNAAFRKKAKTTLQEYLTAVLKDEKLMNSDALYSFLTPIPDFIKERVPEKRSKFFLTNLLKNTLLPNQNEIDSGDLLFYEDSSREDQSKDSIAKPLYELLREVFELRGVFKLFRISFIRFVEITYGRSINRQLREIVSWLISEPMVVYYLTLLKQSFWPNGTLSQPSALRTDDEKLQTRLLAKKKCLAGIPDVVKTLVGEANARKGALKIFEVLQDARPNKHLLYALVELMIGELLPELKQVQPNV